MPQILQYFFRGKYTNPNITNMRSPGQKQQKWESPASVSLWAYGLTPPALIKLENLQPVGEIPDSFSVRQHNKCRQVQWPGVVLRPQDQESAASYTAKEALNYRQDHRSSLKSYLQCARIVSPRKEKNPLHDTKLLLSTLINALT